MGTVAARMAPCVRMLVGGGLVVFQADAGLNESGFAALLGAPGEGRGVFCPAAELEEVYGFLSEQLSPGVTLVGVSGVGTFRVAPVGAVGRLAGRIAIVTGAAQGFGKGLAAHMAAEGALLVVADLNLPLAEQTAAELRTRFGPDAARALPVDVSDGASVEALVEQTVLLYGGLDLMVSNAGVLRAGGLEEIDQKAFEFVTRVNYTGYFLCAKYAAEVMRLQRRFAPGRTADINQINSKSGLEGSTKDFAYAGGKFGGI
ncbi:MAG: SDR family NAD(P)-dependent oxidoreductase, partial [Oscillospiraceae bacterium]|nr:SDR family NAD(P)-dependent oxidoreductase [Oscillospiraceae bacterium]